jgi:hypothetical protein
MNRFVARRLFGDRAITSASGSGIPGRFRFFFSAVATDGGANIIICSPEEETLASSEAVGAATSDELSNSTMTSLLETLKFPSKSNQLVQHEI